MATATGTTTQSAYYQNLSASSGTGTSSPTTATGSSQEIAGNFQDFLLLLTTQLKNQSPLDPLDTNQFTQQLVQFAGVEQQLKSNDTLSSILAATKSTSTSNAAAYIGMNVTADGSSATLSNGSANWVLNASKAAAKAVVTIKNAQNVAVATKTQSLANGSQTFAWDGTDAAGNPLPAGTYTVSVAATDAAGQAVSVTTDVAGTVSAVDVSGQAPVLTVGSATVPLSSVKTVAYK